MGVAPHTLRWKTWRHVGLSFKKDMHGGPGPFLGAIIFLVFPKNHYKNMVFGGPNHSHSDRLSQAVILVRGDAPQADF